MTGRCGLLIIVSCDYFSSLPSFSHTLFFSPFPPPPSSLSLSLILHVSSSLPLPHAHSPLLLPTSPFSLLFLLLPSPSSSPLFFLSLLFSPSPLLISPSHLLPPPSLTLSTIQSVGKQTSLNRQSGRPVAWGFWLANTYVGILLPPLYCLKTHNC